MKYRIDDPTTDRRPSDAAVASPRMVGRRREVEHLQWLLSSAIAGTGGVTTVIGEPGAGKTLLVEAAIDLASTQGMHVRVGRSVDREVERVLGVGLDAFGMCLDQLVGKGTATRFVLEAGAVAASTFLLADRLLEVVEGLCATGPLLLVVDDLQWSDAATLTWLRSVGDRACALPLALLLMTRPVAPGTQVSRLLSNLGGTVLTPAPLADDEVLALAEDVLGRPPDAALSAVLDTAHGNPLLVLAVLERRDRTQFMDSGAGLDRRLGELGAGTLRTVQAAAVLGRQIDLATLSVVLEGSPIELLSHVEDAALAGVLTLDSDRYQFRHDLYREAALSTITRPARSLLHLQAARCLAGIGAPALDVAEHYALGARVGDREAMRWLHEAALDLVAAAPASALRLIEVGLALAGPAPPQALLLVRVRALAGTGRTEEAELLGRSMLHEGLEPAAEAGLRRELGFTALMRGQAAECVTQIERYAQLTEAPAARARIHGELAFARFMALDQAGAQEAAQRAVDGGQRYGDIPAQVAGNSVLCFLDLYAQNLTDAVRRASDIVSYADLPGAADAHIYQPWFIASLVHLETDRPDAVAATARRGRQVALERGVGWAVPGYDAVTAFGELRVGALDDAAASARAALGCLDGVDGLGVAVWCHALLAQVHLHHAEVDDAEAHLAIAESWLSRERAQLGFEQVQLARARLSERQGEPGEALAALRLVWDAFRSLGVLSPLPPIGLPMARLAHGAGDRRLVVEAAKYLDDDATCGAPGVRVVAELAAAWRDVDPDRALSAATLAARGPRPPLVATALTDAAALLRRRRRLLEADRVAGEAAELWASLGACADADACAIASRSGPRPAHRPRYGVGALTATERRVSALVAEGLSNAAVAETLGVSRRTVESHVSSVYRKLEVSSRVALARTALAHDLTAG